VSSYSNSYGGNRATYRRSPPPGQRLKVLETIPSVILGCPVVNPVVVCCIGTRAPTQQGGILSHTIHLPLPIPCLITIRSGGLSSDHGDQVLDALHPRFPFDHHRRPVQQQFSSLVFGRKQRKKGVKSATTPVGDCDIELPSSLQSRSSRHSNRAFGFWGDSYYLR
jgi:hypothetical protein